MHLSQVCDAWGAHAPAERAPRPLCPDHLGAVAKAVRCPSCTRAGFLAACVQTPAKPTFVLSDTRSAAVRGDLDPDGETELSGLSLDPTGDKWTPLKVETVDGRREYADLHRRFADRATTLRAPLIEECGQLLGVARTSAD